MNKFEPAKLFARYADANPSEFFVVADEAGTTTRYRIQHRNTGVRVVFTECNASREFFDSDDSVFTNMHDDHDLAFQMVDEATYKQLAAVCQRMIEEKKINESISHDSKLINLFQNKKDA